MTESEKIKKEICEALSKPNMVAKRIYTILDWDYFTNSLVFCNRFSETKSKEIICKCIDELLARDSKFVCTLPVKTPVYRARKIQRQTFKTNRDGTKKGFNKKESGMPPHRLASNGRVNAVGIPVLYTATESETACAELRPMKNDLLSVAEYKTTEEMRLANFTLDLIDDLDSYNAPFIKELFYSFSLPVSSDLLDYLPTQFIAEYIKYNHEEIAGIRYTSLHNEGGYNIAFFTDEKCRFVKSKVVECSKVMYEYEPL